MRTTSKAKEADSKNDQQEREKKTKQTRKTESPHNDRREEDRRQKRQNPPRLPTRRRQKTETLLAFQPLWKILVTVAFLHTTRENKKCLKCQARKAFQRTRKEDKANAKKASRQEKYSHRGAGSQERNELQLSPLHCLVLLLPSLLILFNQLWPMTSLLYYIMHSCVQCAGHLVARRS